MNNSILIIISIMGTYITIRIKFKKKIIFVSDKGECGCEIIKDLLELLDKYSIKQLIALFDQIELIDQKEIINRSKNNFKNVDGPIIKILNDGYGVDFSKIDTNEGWEEDINYLVDLNAEKFDGIPLDKKALKKLYRSWSGEENSEDMDPDDIEFLSDDD